ncbi:hypothetical protein LOAG_17705 [Loa loa]|uniref:Uncharacterized protein n=1 Tax=Loa loa TaxID=7209 RepID=A0A1S0UHB9_LOALO|nr:hypothetical protein LOAG_17705 [Loa loa]EJD75080.1 hypothetical protein LOAG_17705 [Loa loa]
MCPQSINISKQFRNKERNRVMEMYTSVPKEYQEPEPDYPLSDSDLISYGISQQVPVLRIFETDDLPLHRGDFTSQHAIMVRSRQLSEIAGLIDESVSDQPTLKRFSRHNQSMHFQSSSHMCHLEPGSSQQQQPHTCSKFSCRLKTGFFSGNWTLRGKKELKMRPSVHDITVVQTGKSSSNLTEESPLILGSSTRSSFQLSLQHHFQYHQCYSVNSPEPSDYIHSNHPASINDHRISPVSPHLRNFTSNKFYVDSDRESRRALAETIHTTKTPPQLSPVPENFAQLSTRNPSIATGQSGLIVPVELTTSNGVDEEQEGSVMFISKA